MRPIIRKGAAFNQANNGEFIWLFNTFKTGYEVNMQDAIASPALNQLLFAGRSEKTISPDATICAACAHTDSNIYPSITIRFD
jgi:hypothetical protein